MSSQYSAVSVQLTKKLIAESEGDERLIAEGYNISMKTLKILIIISTIFLNAKYCTAYNSGPLIFVSPDASSVALGGPKIAMYIGSDSIFSNSSLLAKSNATVFSASYKDSMFDGREAALSSAISLPIPLTLGLAWYRYQNELEITNSNAILGKKFYIEDLAYFSLSSALYNKLYVSASAKYINKSFDEFNLSGFVLETSLAYSLFNNFDMGLSLKNIGLNTLKGDSYWSGASIKEELDPVLGCGLCYHVVIPTDFLSVSTAQIRSDNLDLVLTADMNTYSKDIDNALFYYGAQLSFNDYIALRIGLDPYRKIRLGIGLWKIDYSYKNSDSFETEHIFTISSKL